MVSLKKGIAIAALFLTASAYGMGRTVAATSACHGAYGAVALCEAIEERLSTAGVALENLDSTKPSPMFGYCVDGDGGDNPYVASYLIDAYGTQWQDQCLNSTTQIEMVCGFAGQKINVTHTCTCVSEWIMVPGWGNRYAGRCQ